MFKSFKNLRKNNKVIEKDLFASNAGIEFENSAFENTTISLLTMI